MNRSGKASASDAVDKENDEAVEAGAQANAPDTDTTEDHGQLEALRAESQKNLDGWQRTLAEFQNYKRRTEREARESYQNATFDVLNNLLPIVDDFERAMNSLPEAERNQPWLEGVRLIQRKFVRLLDDYNITALDPVGEVFDPTLHQAVGTDENTDVESGHVSETLQKGYVAGDRVLRPAVVKVAR